MKFAAGGEADGPAALVFTYGRMTGNRRQGFAIYGELPGSRRADDVRCRYADPGTVTRVVLEVTVRGRAGEVSASTIRRVY